MESIGTLGQPRNHQTLSARIAAARQTLVDAAFRPEDAALDAEVLAREVLGWDRARLLADGRESPPPGFEDRYQAVIARRVKREPVAMITGHREFWGLDFVVTPDTLVPRPETEAIVEEALRFLPRDGAASVLDVGTGTGCLAIALAHERPAARAVASDISHAALVVAATNARRHGVRDRIRFLCTDLVAGLSLRANVIVSNPPYVPDQPAVRLPPDVVRYEPATALFGGSDGLTVMRRLFATAPAHLADGGRFIVEIGYGQEDDVGAVAAGTGWQVDRILYDLQGIARTFVLGR
jgi:release factor glutamine methyltransferase